MFNLLVKFKAWEARNDSIQGERCFESTEPALTERFKPGGTLDAAQLASLPTLLMTEVGGQGTQNARLVTMTGIRRSYAGLDLTYMPVEGVPPIPNRYLEVHAQELSIQKGEFSRTHWSVKNVDLYHFLLRRQLRLANAPKLFNAGSLDDVDEKLVSVMMPFDHAFDAVYQAVQDGAKTLGMACVRADDIWEADAIIQDVVKLLSRSRVVVCDCTGRNANVFYEIGIAHALGRDTILITQSDADIPFDLRHLRYIRYLPNGEGRAALTVKLSGRMATLSGASASE
jgi:hypothetical protein